MNTAAVILALALTLALAACALAQGEPATADPAAEVNRRLTRGVNMGNMLEAPREGEWGARLEERYFDLAKEAGFQSVRIPVRWSAHASEHRPYLIDAAFMTRVEQAVDQALARGLTVVVNFHHYEEIFEDPEGEQQRFLALWRQVAQHFKNKPESLVFEILNEPNTNLTAELWNDLLLDALDVIRASNPQRMVVIGPARWNNLEELPRLELPAEDRRLIVTFHYYNPFTFTHQGAQWVGQQSQGWLGRTWTGTDAEKQAVLTDFEGVARWSKEHDRPIYMGEFGAYSRADMDSRVLWTRFVREQADAHGFSWAYWEFGAGFGVFDRQANTWRRPLLNTLLPQP